MPQNPSNRSKRGVVMRVFPDERVLVEGVNIVKKHLKANAQKGISGGIIDKEMPIRISNVSLYNPATERGGRVGIKVLEDGRKVRYFKGTGEVVDV